MQPLLFALIVVGLSPAQDPNWQRYKERYHKQHEGDREVAAYKTYIQNHEHIRALNDEHEAAHGNRPFGENPFTDIAPEEFQKTYFGGIPLEPNARVSPHVVEPAAISAPASVDWRQQGAVSAVQNQGGCGDCWAFSAAEQVETGAYFQAGGLQHLSVQQIASCDSGRGDGGCGGGNPINTYGYIQSAGLQSANSYPYTSGNGSLPGCGYNSSNVAAHIGGYSWGIPWCSGQCDQQNQLEGTLQNVIATQGPASISLDATSLQYYSNGVMGPTGCSHIYSHLDHFVQLVGYGTDSSTGQQYWLLRNQWGTGWGESGYARLLFGQNTCGLANQVTYATGVSAVTPPSTPSTPSGGSPSYYFQNKYSNKCIDIPGASTAANAIVQQWDCNGTNAQRYQVALLSNGTYEIQNYNSKLCVTVPGNSTTHGTGLQQQACNGSPGQQWKIAAGASSTYTLTNAASGQCIDDAGWSSNNGTQLIQWDCTGADNQKWVAHLE